MLISFPSGRNTPRKKTQYPNFPSVSLNSSLVRQRDKSLRRVVGQRDGVGIAGLYGLTLQIDSLAGGASVLLLLSVLLDTLQEVVTGAGGLDVLDLDVDALLDVASPDLLVDDDTDSGLGHVVNDTGLSVVDLEGHTVLLSSVDLDVHNVTHTVSSHVGAHRDHTLAAELPAVGVAGARSLSVGVTHGV
jgi:hypothetical protein